MLWIKEVYEFIVLPFVYHTKRSKKVTATEKITKNYFISLKEKNSLANRVQTAFLFNTSFNNFLKLFFQIWKLIISEETLTILEGWQDKTPGRGIFLSRFFFGSFLFINEKEMNIFSNHMIKSEAGIFSFKD